MKLKHLIWLIPALPLIGIVCYLPSSWHNTAPVKPVKARLSGSSAAIETKKSTSDEFAPDGSRIIRPSNYDHRFPDLMRKAQESARIRDESFRKLAEHSTLEKRASDVDAAMKRRDPQYQTLFESLDIDSQRANQALALIRQREIKLGDLMNNYFRDPLNNARAYAANKLKEEQRSRNELSKLLGKSTAASLTALEGRMQDDDLTRAGMLTRAGNQLPQRDD